MKDLSRSDKSSSLVIIMIMIKLIECVCVYYNIMQFLYYGKDK